MKIYCPILRIKKSRLLEKNALYCCSMEDSSACTKQRTIEVLENDLIFQSVVRTDFTPSDYALLGDRALSPVY